MHEKGSPRDLFITPSIHILLFSHSKRQFRASHGTSTTWDTKSSTDQSIIHRILVRLARQLSLDLQRSRGIMHGHHDFYELYHLGGAKLGVVQQIRKLLLRVHRVRLGLLALRCAKRVQQTRPFPVSRTISINKRLSFRERKEGRIEMGNRQDVPVVDIIVLPRGAVEVPLNRVSAVVKQEDNRCNT